jgi:phage terminase Nu1 subunit (DNA packaging protein)
VTLRSVSTSFPDALPLEPDERLLTPEELAAILVIPVRTLARWRSMRTGPVALTIGNHIRYRVAHVNAWLAERERDAAEWMAG